MSDTMTTANELGRTVQDRGVKGLKTEAGAMKRITSKTDVANALHVVVRRPDGLYTPVVFLRHDQLFMAFALANAGIFVMAIA
jgi:hypothetical protein